MSNIVIYGKPGCFYCDEAKKLCSINALEYEWFDVTEEKNKKDMFALYPEAKTVPQIFVNMKHVGGFDDFKKYVVENMQGLGNLK